VDIRSLAFRTELALLQFGSTTVEDRGDHLLVLTPDNPGFWWGNFLLLPDIPSPDEVEPWVQRHGAEIPEAEHVALGFDVTTESRADLAVFAACGMEVDFSSVMTAQRTDPPRRRNPAAVNRLLASDADWEQSVALTLRCYPGEDPVSNERFVRARAASYRRLVAQGHGGWFGAFLDGALVAQLGLFATGTGLARFQAVETDPAFRRQGLAGGMVYDASQYGFAELRASTLVMVADPEYVAIQLYRAVGFTDTEVQLQASRPPQRGVADQA
jgi:ribosomal protein S18 acetylase RimI-like enzyme